VPARGWQSLIPAGIEAELATRQRGQIAIERVVGHIVLEKDHSVPAPGERIAQAPPQRCVAITPRRANRQAKDDEFHSALAQPGIKALAAAGND
jgi:hypothetical protein